MEKIDWNGLLEIVKRWVLSVKEYKKYKNIAFLIF